jgi:ABC-2 type transport system permease protein
MSIADVTRTELLKARRSRVPWLVALGFTAAPVVVGLFMVVLQDPERARRLGLLGTKAALTGGSADWPTMISMLGQALAIGGSVLLAFLTSWVYGREFSDRTLRTLLANPTSRAAVVTAKAIVVTAWGAAIFAWVIALGFGLGIALGLPGWTPSLGADALLRMAGAGALILVLQPMTALLACVGRGYIAGLAWAVLTVALAQILAVLGWGGAFPWAVPALVSGAGGAEMAAVALPSIVLVGVTGALGLLLLVAWWRRVDHAG